MTFRRETKDIPGAGMTRIAATKKWRNIKTRLCACAVFTIVLIATGAFCKTIQNSPRSRVLLTIHYKVVVATGYEAGKRSCGKFADGLNCHNKPVLVGRTMATDPKVFPHFRYYYISGIGWRQAEDVGSDIKGARIDILFKNVHDALQFGRKKVVVMW